MPSAITLTTSRPTLARAIGRSRTTYVCTRAHVLRLAINWRLRLTQPINNADKSVVYGDALQTVVCRCQHVVRTIPSRDISRQTCCGQTSLTPVPHLPRRHRPLDRPFQWASHFVLNNPSDTPASSAWSAQPTTRCTVVIGT